MSWCSEHDCPDTMCDEYEHESDRAAKRAAANENAARVWERRARDMKARLDALQGGSAEWGDILERQVRRK